MPNRRGIRLMMRILAALILLAVANLSSNFYAKPTAAETSEPPSQGLIYGLTSEAVSALQQTAAFPEADAGFSSYYRTRDAGDNFTLDKSVVDGVLLSDPPPRSVRAAPASLVSVGDNYSVASFPVLNIDQTTTSVRVYYDSGGWVVAFFPRGDESSRAWQAEGLDVDNPTLESLDRTTLLDAINAVVSEALGPTGGRRGRPGVLPLGVSDRQCLLHDGQRPGHRRFGLVVLRGPGRFHHPRGLHLPLG